MANSRSLPVIVDVETAGGQMDLPARGAYNYFHPVLGAKILCGYYQEPGGELRDIEDGLQQQRDRCIYAHNVEFDLLALRRHWGRDALPDCDFHCTASLARSLNIPGSLGNACRFLFGEDYHKAAMPPALKAQEDGLLAGAQDAEIRAYCRNDVRITARLYQELKEIQQAVYPGEEGKAQLQWDYRHQEFRIHLAINRKGLPIDCGYLDAALDRIRALHQEADAYVKEHTGLEAKNQRAVIEWLRSKGVVLEDYTLDGLERNLRELLEFEEGNPRQQMLNKVMIHTIRRNYKSLAKYQAVKDKVARDPDGSYWYKGAYAINAQLQGRFSAYGAQFHNFPRRAAGADDVVLDREGIYKATAYQMSRSLRRLVSAAQVQGQHLVGGDFKAIELRLLLHYAGHRDALRDGRDIYKDMAGRIYGKDPAAVSKDERHIGKSAVLGLGYGMGEPAFMQYAGVGQELAAAAVQAYNHMFPRVAGFRKRLMDGWMAPEAELPGGIRLRRVSYKGRQLRVLELPSGRAIIYWDCKEREFDSQASQPSKMFPGRITANCICGIARDILLMALIRYGERESPDHIVGHFHDEILLAGPPGEVQEQALKDVMETPPHWAPDLPLEAECWTGRDWI